MNELEQLLEISPLLAQLVGADPELVALLARAVNIGEEEIRRRIMSKGQTRNEILRDAAKTWDEAVRGAEELDRLGHE